MFCRRITHYRLKIWHVLVAMILAFVLAACSGKNERKPREGEIKINLIAARDINPNRFRHPAPLNVLIYSVKQRDIFSNAEFFEIVDGNSKQVQAAASKIYEAILQPGETRTVFIKPDSDIRTLGFISAYRDLNNAVWLATWDLPEEDKRSWWRIWGNDSPVVNAYFKKTAIKIKKMD